MAIGTQTTGAVFESVSATIGSTPLVRLNRLGKGLPGTVLVKLESRNPGGSVKDRIGLAMIADGEGKGLCKPGETVIIEPTSGNTGIALAMVAAERGYKTILTMPESMSLERRKLLAAFGADLVLTPKEKGMSGAVERARQLVASTEGAFLAGQFENPANPLAHQRTTGPEIWGALSSAEIEMGALVAGVGTGGTISGVGHFLAEKGYKTRIVAVEPQESPIITAELAGTAATPSPHPIQGIGAGFIPKTLDLDVLDEVVMVTGEESIACARSLATEEGLLVGISSGANVVAALRLAARSEMAGKAVVTFAPSTGERYLSTVLWEGVV